MEDAELPSRMLGVIRDLLTDEQRLSAMATAARQLARPDAAEQVARLLVSLAGGVK